LDEREQQNELHNGCCEMKIIVGMSGGVDSAVAALLMKNAGHDVTGVMMSIWDGPVNPAAKKNACYGPDEKEDIEEAEKICGTINIPFRVFDCAKEYRETVLDYFKREYLSARTPNPCVRCNHQMKFGVLLDAARESGMEFDRFATGHYARVSYNADAGLYMLLRAADREKDQSYFLYHLSQSQLAKVIFPLGDFNKGRVREIAREYGLHVSDKEESQDFYGGDYKELIGSAEKPGDITLADGTVVGHHGGLWNFTPGQRRGIGVAYKEPLYVVSLDRTNNRVVVGEKSKTLVPAFSVTDLHWVSVRGITDKTNVVIKTRSSGRDIDGSIEPGAGGAGIVRLHSERESVSPGQSAVFYRGDILLGGGIVERGMDESTH